MERKIKGGILAIIGYLLSPLSWWNDIFINIPIAYLFGLIFSLLSPKLFFPFMIIGYWLTNISGLILIHKGVSNILSKIKKEDTRRELLKRSIYFNNLYNFNCDISKIWNFKISFEIFSIKF